MSPHTVPQHQSYDEFLASFNLSRNGFLPAHEPLNKIPSPYYEPWELLIHNLQGLLVSGTLRQRVENIPVLSTERLRSEPEWRRAYVILTFLLHAYVWGGEKPAEILPPTISVPLLAVSSRLEVPPVATYAALNLWNFSSSTADLTDIDGLASPHTFTGTHDESWFLCVSVAMEAQGAHVIPWMLKAVHAIPSRDYDTITAGLEQLAGSIRKVGALLDRMREHCDPMVFYHQIRPFLAGSKNMGAAGLPRGLFYDEGHGQGSWQQWRGGSNGQSSLIQFWDVVLGVTHTSEGNSSSSSSSHPHAASGMGQGQGQDQSFHAQVREYMPGGHRRFLEHVARSGSIRSLAMVPTCGPAHARMQEVYTAAIKALTEFRNKHLGIIASYIVVPSKKAWHGGAAKWRNLATASTWQQQDARREAGGEPADRELTGTGGTALLPFLKQSRDETAVCGEQVKDRMEARS